MLRPLILTILMVSFNLYLVGCQSSSAPTTSSMTVSSVENITPTVQIQDFVTNLTVPWEVAFAPEGRIFITERSGKIVTIENGQVQTDPWMTINVAAVGEGGLLGLALDPNFQSNHFVYVAYTFNDSTGNLKNQLVRLKEDPYTGKGTLDKVLLNNANGGSVHDGGRVKFGPDGKLYWTLGETGVPSLSQDLNSLNGKILRLNPDGTIPTDNPFLNSPVYSLGHRNPQGIAWQPGTNRLYETEHGPSGGQYGYGQDEVNYIQPGKNYGWPDIYGNRSQEGMIKPIIQSGNNETWAPSGTTFVNGGPWDGSFLFTGLAGEALYRVTLDKTDPTKVLNFDKLFPKQFGRLRDVIQGPDGNLYILTNNTDGRGNPKPGDDRILRLNFR